MYDSVTHRFPRKSFLAAIILHVLFTLSFVTLITLQTAEPKQPPDLQSIPSYIYHPSIQPAPASQPTAAANLPIVAPQDQHENAAAIKPQPQKITRAKNAIYTRPKLKKMSVAKLWGDQASIMDNSRQILRQNQISRAMNRDKDPDPVLLIGDPNTEASPLIKLMARALSANFRYPKIEGNFGIRGRVLVQLTFHPEGYFSDPEIIQSSDNENFDTAALYAVNKAPRVSGAKRYLSAPKSYVVGFIFD